MNGSQPDHAVGLCRALCIACLGIFPALNLPAQTWTNTALSSSQRAALLVNAMTPAEKMALVGAGSGPYVGNIPAIPRLGIPALTMQDGPAGVRVSDASTTGLPAPITLGATWDVALARQYGVTIGEEARGKGVEVQLGPMMNMARAYEAGRNFEGYGEDPALAGAMAAAVIQGIQSRGVIATAKHFVANDQETLRNVISSDADERTLQEIYYWPFLQSVRAGVGAVMASYNRVNSRYACELEALNATLKKLWGFEGLVMSDWGAGFSTVGGMNNGLDQDMYSGRFTTNAILAAIQSGAVSASTLDGMAKRILTSMFQFGDFDNPPSGTLSSPVMSAAHTQLARAVAANGIVLLKNSNGLLPLRASVHSIAVIGSAGSATPISVGGGSASVNLPYNVTPLSGITNRAGDGVTVSYAQGDGASIPLAVQLATQCDVAIVCVGQQTSEGSDRASLSLPSGQDALVAAVAAANPRTLVVLYASSATLMPWADSAAAILAAWYPGQENGNALAQVLFGDVNPSGKLPVTIPASAGQVPANATAQFPGASGHVVYSEGLQIGHRWYDANSQTPRFPFGFGLSYTTFGYSNLTVSAVSASGQVRIGFDLTNTGGRTGSEVAELYLGFPSAAGEPPKLLKGFQKVSLAAGQSQHVTLNLTWEDLANWDATARGWVVTPGIFQVLVGSSSRDIRLSGSFDAGTSIPSSDLANSAQHRAVTVSSAAAANASGAAAVDGDGVSGWTSMASDPQWLTVDLGLIKDLSRVRLRWGTNYASSYLIQISSNNATWSGVYTNAGGAGGTEDLLVSGRGRYVRLYGNQRSAGGAYSLLEIEVYAQPQRPIGGVVRWSPGRIQAEDYDAGGESVAYLNTTAGNPGGVYRADDVDIQATADTGGGYNVVGIKTGEWLEYTVNPPDTLAIYRITARVAAPVGGGQLRVRLDGKILGTVAVPNTGGGQTWQTVTFPDAPVEGGAGSKALRLEALSGGFNLNWINLDRVQVCGAANVAKGQSSSASSQESSSYPAANAFDGDPTTRWSSAFSDPQWIEVDLGSVRAIARVRLTWENAFSQSYSVQFSTNHATWTSVCSTTSGAGGLSDLAVQGPARYVRLYSTQRATQYGNSLFEFEVYAALQPAAVGNTRARR